MKEDNITNPQITNPARRSFIKAITGFLILLPSALKADCTTNSRKIPNSELFKINNRELTDHPTLHSVVLSRQGKAYALSNNIEGIKQYSFYKRNPHTGQTFGMGIFVGDAFYLSNKDMIVFY